MNRKVKLAIMGTIAGALAGADNCIKNKIESGKINNGVIDKRGFAEIKKHHNKGIPLNKLDNHTKEITAVSTAMLSCLSINAAHNALNYDDAVMEIANTLIMGGALSNTYDRISKGYVVDYLMIGKKRAIYNISDFMIMLGVVVSIIGTLKGLSD